MNEEREELERLLDDLGADQTEEGDRLVALPSGAVLKVMMDDSSPDFYAEAEVCDLDETWPAASRYARIASLNMFWRELGGFSAALRGRTLYVETRENMARMIDIEDFHRWLFRADGAVQTAFAVATAPTGILQNRLFEDEAVDEAGRDSDAAVADVDQHALGGVANGGMIWP